MEAFTARTRIRIYAAHGLLFTPGSLLVDASFHGAALEFGGRYRCAGGMAS